MDGPMNDSMNDSTSGPRIVSRTRFIPAPASKIFDLLADPRRHHLIDGSDSLKGAHTNAPRRLLLGARFSMNMKIGLSYRITNEVVEFEEPHRIAWRHFGGHVWRYIIDEVDGGCRVTEQFDWRTSKSPILLKLTGAEKRNAASIEATLDRLAAVMTA